jgi:NAD(P)-dependent dehydrogenase (short-subunit alcohol dehydrogenase family)
MSMEDRMDRGVFVVTGGSRGIGAVIAAEAAEAGYHVLLTYAGRADAGQAVVDAIKAKGGQATAVQADTGKGADIARLFAAADRIGQVTAFVYNGGVTGGAGRLEDQSDETLAEVVAVNLTGAMIASREAVRRMSTKHGGKGGAIVLLSSLAVRLGMPGQHIWYAASKGGIDSFAIGLSKEVALEGIRVNVVAPGPIDTEIHAPGHLARIADNLPMKRAGQPEEVSAAVMFLVSDRASYISGATIEVGGAR